MKSKLSCALLGAALVAAIVAVSTPVRSARNDRYRPGDWVSFSVSNYIAAVAAGPNETYFGSTGGILRYDVFQDRWKPPYTTSDGLASSVITAVGQDPFSDFLWCATELGVSKQHPASRQWTNFSKVEVGISLSDEIVSIGFDSQANWFESRAGRLFHQEKFGGLFTPASPGEVDGNSNIRWFGWRGTPEEPLPHFFMPNGYLFDPAPYRPVSGGVSQFGAVQDNRLRRAPITSASDDHLGSLWMGTWGLGSMKGDLRVDRAEVLQFGLVNERVDALLFEDESLWIGGRHSQFTGPFEEGLQGITHWKRPNPQSSDTYDWEYFDARYNMDMSSDEVHNFDFADDVLYCATENGINIYNSRKNRWRRIVASDGLAHQRVNDVLVHGFSLFAATDLGLNQIDLETIGQDSLEVQELFSNELRHVNILALELQQNLLWIGTDRGLFVANLLTGEGGYLAGAEGPVDVATYAISYSDSLVWVGSEYGVDAFDINNEEWLLAPERTTLEGAYINCLTAGPDAVWVGTDRGAFKFHRTNREWRRYTRDDGLLDDHVNVIRVVDDLVWFGTDLGLTVFRWRAYHDFD